MAISNRVLIIDAYNLFTRHYVAHPGMSKNGEQVGGVVGFFNNMLRLIEKTNPECVYVIWEAGGSKKKRDLYPDYKQKRRPQKLNRYYEDIPDSVQNRNFQVSLLVKLLNLVPIVQIYVNDAEADDAIGYMSKYKLKHKNKIIVSSDHDFYQLVGEDLIIWSPTLKAFVDTKKVISRFGIHPNNFCLAKAIAGDSSDNIPGVKGVSYKSLSKYFSKFIEEDDYLLEEFFDDVRVIKESKRLKILESLSDSTTQNLIRRNWKLVHLDVNNLCHTQVQKINQKIENIDFTNDNIGVHKLLNENGIVNIDLLKARILFNNIKPRKNT